MSLEDFAVFAVPAVFVLLWSTGFVGAKYGLQYAEPLTYLALRMLGVLSPFFSAGFTRSTTCMLGLAVGNISVLR
jgi:hypothetical protein